MHPVCASSLLPATPAQHGKRNVIETSLSMSQEPSRRCPNRPFAWKCNGAPTLQFILPAGFSFWFVVLVRRPASLKAGEALLLTTNSHRPLSQLSSLARRCPTSRRRAMATLLLPSVPAGENPYTVYLAVIHSLAFNNVPPPSLVDRIIILYVIAGV